MNYTIKIFSICVLVSAYTSAHASNVPQGGAVVERGTWYKIKNFFKLPWCNLKLKKLTKEHDKNYKDITQGIKLKNTFKKQTDYKACSDKWWEILQNNKKFKEGESGIWYKDFKDRVEAMERSLNYVGPVKITHKSEDAPETPNAYQQLKNNVAYRNKLEKPTDMATDTEFRRCLIQLGKLSPYMYRPSHKLILDISIAKEGSDEEIGKKILNECNKKLKELENIKTQPPQDGGICEKKAKELFVENNDVIQIISVTYRQNEALIDKLNEVLKFVHDELVYLDNNWNSILHAQKQSAGGMLELPILYGDTIVEKFDLASGCANYVKIVQEHEKLEKVDRAPYPMIIERKHDDGKISYETTTSGQVYSLLRAQLGFVNSVYAKIMDTKYAEIARGSKNNHLTEAPQMNRKDKIVGVYENARAFVEKCKKKLADIRVVK